ncbi:MAG TPA: hypothetical protein VLJ80_01115, partial [Solirubrobacteraceae bacterium]|nr:hypothetical protein [Solirubrobacteraceae bacterium]
RRQQANGDRSERGGEPNPRTTPRRRSNDPTATLPVTVHETTIHTRITPLHLSPSCAHTRI